MNSEELCHHVSDMMSAASSLEYLQERLEDDKRFGEAFLLQCIQKTISAGAEAFSAYDVQVQQEKSRKENPAPVLELVKE